MKALRPTLLAASCLLVAGAAQAQGNSASQYPEKAITFIIPLPPGGSADLQGRLVTEHLAKKWGKPVVVENRPGATGTVGLNILAKAAPDGYTLGLSNSGSQVSYPLMNKVEFDTIKSFSPVSGVGETGYLIMVNPARVAATTMADFITYLKANPGKVSFGTIGEGGGSHISMALVMVRTGTKMIHAPYKGSAPMMTDFSGGHIDAEVDVPVTGMPLIRSGKARALVTTTGKRLASLPDVPALGEIIPGAEVTVWNGVVAPAGVNKDIVEKLSAEIRALLKTQDAIDKLANVGLQPIGSTPSEFADKIARDLQTVKPVIEQAGLAAKP